MHCPGTDTFTPWKEDGHTFSVCFALCAASLAAWFELGAFKYSVLSPAEGVSPQGDASAPKHLVGLRARSQGCSVLWTVTGQCRVHTALLHFGVPLSPCRESINNMISFSEKPSLVVRKCSQILLKGFFSYQIVLSLCYSVVKPHYKQDMLVGLLLQQCPDSQHSKLYLHPVMPRHWRMFSAPGESDS